MMTTVYDHLVKLKKNKNTENKSVKNILSGYNGNVTALKQALKEYLDELKKATSVSEIPVPVVPVVPTVDTPDEQKVDTPGVGDVDQTDSSDTKSDVNQAGGIFEDVTQSQDGSESDNGHGKYTEKKTKKNQNKTTTYEFTISLEGKFSIQIIGKTTATREYGKIDNVKKLISEAVTQETDKAKEFKEAITNATTYKDIKNAFANYIKKSDGQNVVFDDKTLFIDVLPKGNDLTSLANAVKAEINTSLT